MSFDGILVGFDEFWWVLMGMGVTQSIYRKIRYVVQS